MLKFTTSRGWAGAQAQLKQLKQTPTTSWIPVTKTSNIPNLSRAIPWLLRDFDFSKGLGYISTEFIENKIKISKRNNPPVFLGLENPSTHRWQHGICFLTKWPYLGKEAAKQKNNGTFYLQLLKLEKTKWSYFCILCFLSRDMAISWFCPLHQKACPGDKITKWP